MYMLFVIHMYLGSFRHYSHIRILFTNLIKKGILKENYDISPKNMGKSSASANQIVEFETSNQS